MSQYIKTEHYGFGFTKASKAKKRALVTAFAVFLAISFLFSAEVMQSRLIYIAGFAALAVTFSRYNKSNKKMLSAPPASSLPKKLMVSLYCATPSVLVGTYFLIVFTASYINITSGIGTGVFEAATAAITIGAIYAIYTVRKSTLLENKSVYTVSIAALIIIGIISVFASLFGGMFG